MQRKLTAILSADVVGFSGLMESDETGTLERLKANRVAIFDPSVAKHGGRVFKLLGDGALVEFSSVVAAVNCALAIQDATEKAGTEDAKPIRYRIGINLGDVIIDGDDIYGEGVNVAARLQTLAPAGGVAVARVVKDQVDGKASCSFEDIGARTVKNIARPIHVFFVSSDSQIDEAANKVTGGIGGSRSTTKSAMDADLTLPSNPSIAVLPFINLSGDSEQDYFADGMVEEITTSLSRFKSLFVIASGSGLSFKGKSVSPHEVARQLGVRYVLEGSVRKSANRVRIAVKLIDAADDRQIWADRFEDTLEDVFALQDKVALSVAGVVEPALDALETRRAWLRPAVDMGSYDLWLRASSLWRTFAKTDILAGLDLLNQSIALDPQFALAAAQAAWSNAYILANGWSDDADAYRRSAIELGHRALQLGSDDPDVLAWVALSQWRLGEDLNAAVALMERAIAMNPGSAQTWYFSSILRLASGEPDVAIEQLQKSIRLDPLSSPNKPLMPYLWGFARFLEKRFDEANSFLREAVQRTPFPAAYLLLAASSAHTGESEVAQNALAMYRALSPIPADAMASALGSHFKRADDRKTLIDGVATAGRNRPARDSASG